MGLLGHLAADLQVREVLSAVLAEDQKRVHSLLVSQVELLQNVLVLPELFWLLDVLLEVLQI